MTTLTTTSSGTLPAERAERMKDQARASKADATWRAYRADWRVWAAWAAAEGKPVLPANANDVAAFMSDMSRTRKLSTLRRYLASISVGHTLKGFTFDRKHAGLKAIMRGVARENERPVRRVRPLTADRVRALLSEMTSTVDDVRDAALLALGVASGCRRSELACLDWQERGEGLGVLELTDDGATITLYRSKTSQGAPAQVFLQPGLALASLRRWIEAAAIEPGTPLFRQIGRGRKVQASRLSDGSIARIVKRRLEAGGLDASEFSGHSLRSGMVTSAALAGVPTWRIKRHSRHRSNVVEQYIRPIEDAKLAFTNELGL